MWFFQTQEAHNVIDLTILIRPNKTVDAFIAALIYSAFFRAFSTRRDFAIPHKTGSQNINIKKKVKSEGGIHYASNRLFRIYVRAAAPHFLPNNKRISQSNHRIPTVGHFPKDKSVITPRHDRRWTLVIHTGRWSRTYPKIYRSRFFIDCKIRFWSKIMWKQPGSSTNWGSYGDTPPSKGDRCVKNGNSISRTLVTYRIVL